MQIHQQRQQPEHRQKWRQTLKQLPWKRIITFVVAVLLITVGAIFWILNSLNVIQGPWITILTAIFVACGVVIGLLQWLFPISSHKPQQDTMPSPQSYAPQIVVHVPPLQHLPQPTQSIPSSQVEVPSQTDSTTIQQSEQAVKVMDESGILRTDHRREDWGEMPHIGNFYGRDKELTLLMQWILNEQCRVVAVLGMGGVGKTALSAQLAKQSKDKFQYIFWRSLQNALPLESFLKNSIGFFSNQTQVALPKDQDGQITLLLQYLRKHRCLLVLDNVETILQSGVGAGNYREGYEGYGSLIQRVGETDHPSCLLLTSREKPKEVARMEGSISPIRSLQLSGLGQEVGQELLRDKGLIGSDEAWDSLISLYTGNPLYLKVVAEPIREVFGGDITKFLKKGRAVFGDIRDPLDLQFARLTEREREIMYWLAIEREAVSLEDLCEDMGLSIAEGAVLEALNSLRRRSLIEGSGSAQFSLQPVVMEYMTARFVEQVSEELATEALELFVSHAPVKAIAKDYVRNSQVRLILTPLAERLSSAFGETGSEQKLKAILSTLRKVHSQKSGYAAGNLLNLLIHLHADLRGVDFSHLIVRQAYLQGIMLPEVNFAHARLERSVFTETFGSILSVSFSPNGELLAAGTANGEIRVWYVPDATPVRTYQAHIAWIWSVTFSPDGKLLASGSEDQTIRIWEVQTGRCVSNLQGHTNRIRSVAFSPDGNLLVSGSEDQTVRLWEARTGQCFRILHGHTHPIYTVAFSPDGSLLASGSEDQTVRLWEAGTGRCIQVMPGHTQRVYAITFSPDGSLLASGSEDQTLRLWEISSGHCLQTLQGHTNRIRSVAFGPSGNILASGSEDQTVRIWEVRTGQCLNTFQGHTNWIRSVAFSPDESKLASGSADQSIRLWEVRTGQCLRTLRGYTNQVWSVAFSSDESAVASGSEDQTVRLWEVRTGGCVRALQGHNYRVESIAFSPDGSMLATGSGDQSVRLWEVHTGRCLQVLRGHTNWIRSVTFSPDGSLLASGGDDRTVRLWEISTRRCLRILKRHTHEIWSVAFSPDGNLLATGSEDQTVQLWEVSTGRWLRTLQAHTNWVRSVAFSPDGRMLASGSDDQTVRLWEVSTGHCLMILQGHTNWVYSVAFSPIGSLLASGNGDQTVRLWEISTGRCITVLQGHTNRVRSIAFSPDGSILASGSEDGTIRLWNVRTGECLKTLRSERPYERMNITGVVGLTEAQKAMLKALGAIEDEK